MGFFIGAGVVIAFAVLLAAAAWGDIRNYRIPNFLVAAFLVLFVLAYALGLIPRHEIVSHLGVGIVALLLGMALFRFHWIGGGDAKFIAALALWAGWPEAIRLVVAMALAGGVVSVLVLLWSRASGRIPGSGNEGKDKLRRQVPYGVAIALAGFDFWLRKLAAPLFFS